MSDILIQLFERLDFSWNISGDEFKGEDPACDDIRNEIFEELKQLDIEDVKDVLIELTDEQLEQITSIIEEIIHECPDTEEIFVEINSERNIKDLDSELKFLGIIEK